MAFPTTPTQVRVDLNLAGVWTDITGDVYTRDGLSITRGQPNEAVGTDPSRLAITLNNRAGKYSPRNPLSPYYGVLGRNTPIRMGVGVPPAGTAATGLTGTSLSAPTVNAEGAGNLYCAWAADPVGNFTGPGGFTMGTERDGTNGTFGAGYKSVTAGATGASTATFSTTATGGAALSIFVPGAGQTVVGFSGIQISSGGLTVACAATTGDVLLAIMGWDTDPGDAMVILPTDFTSDCNWCLVADSGPSATGPRLTAYTMPITSPRPSMSVGAWGRQSHPFTDNFLRLYVITGATAWNQRFTGEVSTWPTKWDLSGADVYTPISGSGILRRLTQGASPLRSPFRRYVASEPSVYAYWPCEDSTAATSFGSALPSGNPAGYSGIAPAFATDSLWTGSDPLPTFLGSAFRARVPAYPDRGEWQVNCLIRLPAGGVPANTQLLNVVTGGTIGSFEVVYTTATTLTFNVRDSGPTYAILAGAVLDAATGTIPAVTFAGTAFLLTIAAQTQGANVAIAASTTRITETGTAQLNQGVSVGGPVVTQTMGRVVGISAGLLSLAAFPAGTPGFNVAVSMGHFSFANRLGTSDGLFANATALGALNGWVGERSGARFARLFQQESLRGYQHTTGGDTLLGPEPLDASLVDVLASTVVTDGGIMYEPRGALALAYLTRQQIYNEATATTLDYTARQVAEPFEPTDDDQSVINDVTVARRNGASARSALDVGSLSTVSPPNGIGRYDTQITTDVQYDADLQSHADWALHIGTWDETRFPSVHVDLAATPSSVSAVTAVDVGDRFAVTNTPAWLPPGPLDLIARGFTESIGPIAEWDVTINATPFGPYRVMALDDATYGRLDGDGAVLYAPATSGATVILVDNAPVANNAPLSLWSATAIPYNLLIAGEEMTATVVQPAIYDLFNRTTANGWGTADIGGAWSVSSGSTSDYSTSGNQARVLHSTVNVTRRTTLTQLTADVDIYCDIGTTALVTGAVMYGGLIARSADANNYWIARLDLNTDQTMTAYIQKSVAGVVSTPGFIALPGLTHVANRMYRIRFQCLGSRVRAKFWDPTLTSEPGPWTLSVNDSALNAVALIGTQTTAFTGNTNVNPTYLFDNFLIVNPQQITVTRAVNGIVKAHAVAEPVHLFNPAVWAL